MSTSKGSNHQLTSAYPIYSGKRILVAEDNAVNRKIVLALLAKFQLKPDVAENGREALDLLAKHSYDLVLMDCQMPIMDGYEATRIQRQREIITNGSARSPIVALTAHATSDAREICLSAGMDDYLSKPINRTELTEVLIRWLGKPEVIDSESPYYEIQTSQNRRREKECWDEALTLKYIGGDQDLLIELMLLFIENIPKRLLDVQNALEKNDWHALANAAHAIKGMTSGFFAEPATSLAVKLEDTARQAIDCELPVISAELTEALSQLISVFQQQSQGIN